MPKPDFAEIKRVCHGMMRVEAYEAIYDAGRKAPGSLFVEVGTGHGAGTVCLALALRDTGRKGLVCTFDRFEGGSRAKYGGVEDNLRHTRNGLNHFGVSGFVKIIVGNVSHMAVEVPESVEIGLLMLDCDGRIDRDFRLFFDRLLPGSPVILDDMADKVRIRDKGARLRVDQKHRLTYLLTKSAMSAGLIKQTGKVENTWFGEKAGKTFADWTPEKILDCYRKLVFADAMKA